MGLLVQKFKFIQGPEFTENLSDDLIFGDAADDAAAAVDGRTPFIPHNKIIIFRYLIWEICIAFAQSFFADIRFIKSLAV